MKIEDFFSQETITMKMATGYIKLIENFCRKNGTPACLLREYNMALKAIRMVKESGDTSPEMLDVIDKANTFLLNVGAIQPHKFEELMTEGVFEDEDCALMERMKLAEMAPKAQRKTVFTLFGLLPRRYHKACLGFFSSLQYAESSMMGFIADSKRDLKLGNNKAMKGFCITESGLDYITTAPYKKTLSIRNYDEDGNLTDEKVNAENPFGIVSKNTNPTYNKTKDDSGKFVVAQYNWGCEIMDIVDKQVEDLIIPQSLEISGNAYPVADIKLHFHKFKTLKRIAIEANLPRIKMFTFRDCPNLERVVIAGRVSSIVSETFFNCPALRDVIATNETRIAQTALKDCPNAIIHSVQPTEHIVDYLIKMEALCGDSNIRFINYDSPLSFRQDDKIPELVQELFLSGASRKEYRAELLRRFLVVLVSEETMKRYFLLLSAKFFHVVIKSG